MSGEITLHRPDGTTRDAEFNAIANFIPGHHLSILRDISDRKQAEVQLRQREEFLNGIYNAADQAVFVIDVVENHDFRYVAFNHHAERYVGVSQQDIQGKSPEVVFGAVTGATFRQSYERCL
ncbi:PAS domain-containing protein [Leptodesmis sp.]|uniref:PAS domain-containing protein n=1 Tax=Leptodesmis sp. TaxID=3100501 RepID=UPI0040534D97